MVMIVSFFSVIQVLQGLYPSHSSLLLLMQLSGSSKQHDAGSHNNLHITSETSQNESMSGVASGSSIISATAASFIVVGMGVSRYRLAQG